MATAPSELALDHDLRTRWIENGFVRFGGAERPLIAWWYFV